MVRTCCVILAGLVAAAAACGDDSDDGQDAEAGETEADGGEAETDDSSTPDEATAADEAADVFPDTGPPGALEWTTPENVSESPTSFSDIRYQWGRSLAVDETGTVHVVWREVLGEYPDGRDQARIVYRRRDPAGWLEPRPQDLTTTFIGAGHPKVAVSGSDILVVWHVHDPAPATDRILFTRSPAGGATGTFSTPQEIVTDAVVTAANPLGEYSTTPSLAVDGSRVHVVWSDERVVATCGGSIPEIYLASSPDLGDSWSAPSQISSADCRSSWTPSVAAADGFVHVAWTDERHNPVDCGLTAGSPCREEEYYRRVADDGATVVDPEVRLTADAPGSEAESWGPSLAVVNGVVHVVWYDRAGGGDFQVLHRRSTDNGASWPVGAQLLGVPPAGCRAACATVAGEAPQLHAVWFEICGDTRSTIRHAWSLDLGDSWSLPSDVTSGTGVLAVHPHVAFRGGVAHVVWNDNADAEIWYARAR
jgi:hypothetical protein